MIEVTVVPRALDGVRQVGGVDRLWLAAPGVPCKSPTSCPPMTRQMCRWNGMHVTEWMAVGARPCFTCGGKGKLGRYPIFNGPNDLTDCPDCLDGKPLVELRAPYCNCRPGLDGTGWYHERDCVGTVSAGVWKLVAGPARLVPDHALPDDALAYVVRDEDDCGWWYYPPDADDPVYRPDLTHLHDGDPSTLVGQWAVELERVASQTLPRPHLTDPEAGK